jgi:hypothetical protein
MWYVIIVMTICLIPFLISFLDGKKCNCVNQSIFYIREWYNEVLQEPISSSKIIKMTELAICAEVYKEPNRIDSILQDFSHESISNFSQKITLKVCKWILSYCVRYSQS